MDHTSNRNQSVTVYKKFAKLTIISNVLIGLCIVLWLSSTVVRGEASIRAGQSQVGVCLSKGRICVDYQRGISHGASGFTFHVERPFLDITYQFQWPEFYNRVDSIGQLRMPYSAIVLPYWLLIGFGFGLKTVIRLSQSGSPKPDLICHNCSYDLRGCISTLCPECGTEIPPEQMERIRTTKQEIGRCP